MIPQIDLASQVYGTLPKSSGGTGSADAQTTFSQGVVERFQNKTGSTIARGSLVKLEATDDEPWAMLTDGANDANVIGVAYGLWDDLGTITLDDVLDGQQLAVMRTGRCDVLVAGTVTRGEYAVSSSTDGKATSTATFEDGIFGRFVSTGTDTLVPCEIGTALTSTTGALPGGGAGGDLSGLYPDPNVIKVNGISVNGTTVAGYILIATSATSATWQPQANIGHWEVLMADGVTAPPDPIQNEDEDDWLYGLLA
jgi:hypothetical protein